MTWKLANPLSIQLSKHNEIWHSGSPGCYSPAGAAIAEVELELLDRDQLDPQLVPESLGVIASRPTVGSRRPFSTLVM